MAASRNNSLLLKALRREPVERVPIWLMRQAGRYMPEYRMLRERVDFLTLCKSPKLCAEAMAAAVERLGVDAAILFSDLLPMLEPMGFALEYAAGDGPIIKNPFRSTEDLRRVAEPKNLDALSFAFEAAAETRRIIPDKPLIGFAGSPFTLAGYVIEGGTSRNFLKTKTLMYTEPEIWHELLARLARTSARYLNGQIAAGAEAVQIFDSWVGVLNEEDYRRFVMPHVQNLIAEIDLNTPSIYFGAGNPALIPAFAELGAACVGIDWRVKIADARKTLGPRTAVQGNLDPAVLLTDRKTIEREAKKILDSAAGSSGFIFNLGHGVPKESPVENVEALVRFVKEYALNR